MSDHLEVLVRLGRALALALGLSLVLAACGGEDGAGAGADDDLETQAQTEVTSFDDGAPDETSSTTEPSSPPPTEPNKDDDSEQTSSSSTTTETSAPPTSPAQKPAQTLRIHERTGVVHEFQGTLTIATYLADEGMIGFEPPPQSVEVPGLLATVRSEPSTGNCPVGDDGRPLIPRVFIGQNCVYEFSLAETDDYAASTFTVVVAGTAGWTIDYTIVSGPPQITCYGPGATPPNLILEARSTVTPGTSGAGDPSTLALIALQDFVVDKPDGSTDAVTVVTDSTFGVVDETQREEFTFRIPDDLESGSVIRFQYEGLIPGLYLVSLDDPITFEWTVDTACG